MFTEKEKQPYDGANASSLAFKKKLETTEETVTDRQHGADQQLPEIAADW